MDKKEVGITHHSTIVQTETQINDGKKIRNLIHFWKASMEQEFGRDKNQQFVSQMYI